MYCKKCGADLPEGRQFCDRCGAAVGAAQNSSHGSGKKRQHCSIDQVGSYGMAYAAQYSSGTAGGGQSQTYYSGQSGGGQSQTYYSGQSGGGRSQTYSSGSAGREQSQTYSSGQSQTYNSRPVDGRPMFNEAPAAQIYSANSAARNRQGNFQRTAGMNSGYVK